MFSPSNYVEGCILELGPYCKAQFTVLYRHKPSFALNILKSISFMSSFLKWQRTISVSPYQSRLWNSNLRNNNINVWCNENRTKALVKHYCAWFDFYCIRRYKGAGKTHFYLGNPMMHGSFLNRRLFKVSAGKILFKDIILCSRQILVSPPSPPIMGLPLLRRPSQ